MLTKAQFKFVKSLASKKARDEHGLFIAEGPKVVEELLQTSNIEPEQIFALPGWIENKSLQPDLVMEVDEETLGRISGLSTANSVVGIFHKPEFEPAPVFEKQISLILDEIQDPGNLGTIIRCADWFNISNIICSPSCADAFNSKVIQSTMGSLGRVRVITEELLPFVQLHCQIPLYATALNGTNLSSIQKPDEAFLLIGNESRGVNSDLLALASVTVTISRLGQAESLNAAVATGIILSHLCG